MDLTEQYLEHYGKLFRYLLLHCALCQVYFESGQLFGEEVGVLVVKILLAPSFSLQVRKLGQDQLYRQVPAAPERMIMCLRNFGMRDRVAVICAHDALCKEIVAEEGSDHQILTE